MLPVIICAVFGYFNAKLAKQKGLNATLWVVLTVVAFFVAMILALMFVIAPFYKGALNNAAVEAYLMEHMAKVWLVMALATGGCLLVRFILENKPDKQEPKSEHWMDRIDDHDR